MLLSIVPWPPCHWGGSSKTCGSPPVWRSAGATPQTHSPPQTWSGKRPRSKIKINHFTRHEPGKAMYTAESSPSPGTPGAVHWSAPGCRGAGRCCPPEETGRAPGNRAEWWATPGVKWIRKQFNHHAIGQLDDVYTLKHLCSTAHFQLIKSCYWTAKK